MIEPIPSQFERVQAQVHAVVAFWGAQGHTVRAWVEEVQTKLGATYIVKTDMINALPRSFTPNAPSPDIFPALSIARRNEKRKHARGVTSPNAKLNEDSVRAIRRQHSTGRETITKIAADHGVSRFAVSCVVNGVRWTHVE